MPDPTSQEATAAADAIEQRQLLDRARLAAAAGDATGMLEALAASRFLDGLKRRLQVKADRDGGRSSGTARGAGVDLDVDQAVSEAIDAFYDQSSRGVAIRDVPSFLMKVATNKLTDIFRVRQREGCSAEVDEIVDGHGSVLDELVGREHRQIDYDRRRMRAFQLVRDLLPRLGQVRVQQVMALILDAAQRNLADLPDAVVAETLGITRDAAKKARQRGFQRLQRIANDEGLGIQILESVGYQDEADGDD
ncbi:MAG: hypothetical protein K2Y37_01185 [Pirellulales bacterium]|nr:hypothetical protein [Pirellulales bacterium]